MFRDRDNLSGNPYLRLFLRPRLFFLLTTRTRYLVLETLVILTLRLVLPTFLIPYQEEPTLRAFFFLFLAIFFSSVKVKRAVFVAERPNYFFKSLTNISFARTAVHKANSHALNGIIQSISHFSDAGFPSSPLIARIPATAPRNNWE